MDTDPRDDEFRNTLRQLTGDDQVAWNPSRLDYHMSGALNPRKDEFASSDGHQLFFNIKKTSIPAVVIPERLKGPLSDNGEEFFYRTGLPATVNSGFREPAEQAKLSCELVNGRYRDDA